MRADQFVVQNNVKLKFVSEGIEYTMNLAIENGLIILDSRLGKQIIFLGEKEEYRGEPVEVKHEVIEDVTHKPKKRSKRKKNN